MAAAREGGSETKLCGNCKKEIPEANFTIHEIHCSRNIGICPTCKEPFPKSELMKHHEKEHTQVYCKCSMKMDRGHLKEHAASECPLRSVTCQHCDIELAFNRLQEHEDYCGARTERCRRCRRNIMLKDLKEHPEDCDKMAEAAASQPKPCFGAEVDAHNIQAIRNIFHPVHATEAVPRASNRLPDGRMYSCLSREQLPREFARRNISPGPADPNQAAHVAKAAAPIAFGRPPECDLDYMLALSLQQEHGSHVHSAATAVQSDLWMNICPSKTRAVESLVEEPNPFPQEAQEPEQPKTEALLPCEFCEELYPEEVLILHQTGCSPTSALASYSKGGSFNPQSDNLHDLWQQLQSNQAMGSGERPTFLQDSLLIPCEFCGAQLEEEILFHHQDQCDLRPATASSTRGMPALQGSPAMENREESESPELPRRRVHNQGEILPPCFEEFRPHKRPQPCQGGPCRNNLVTARRMQLASHESCCGNPFGPPLGEKPQGSEPSASWCPSEPPAALLPTCSPLHFSLSNYKSSFPETAPTRTSLRNEGGRSPARPTDYKPEENPWAAEAEAEEEEEDRPEDE